MNTYTRILSKPAVQQILRMLRTDEDLEVSKRNGGYEVVDVMRDDAFVFRAMNGNRNYICRINADYLPQAV